MTIASRPILDAPAAQPAATVFVCGAVDRGDDGAAVAAVASLPPEALAGVRLRIVDQLRIEELVDAASLGPVVIADAAVGLRPGGIAVLPAERLRAVSREMRPRSSHELGMADTVDLAGMLLGRPIDATVVVVGAASVVPGAALSPVVRQALPRFGFAIVHEARRAVDEARSRSGPAERPAIA